MRQTTRALRPDYEMLLSLLRQYVRPYRRLVTVLMVLQLISTLASLYLPTLNAAIIDDGVSKGDTATIVKLGGVMLAVTGLAGAVLDRGDLLRLTDRDGVRARPALGDVPSRHYLLRARDRPVRGADVADPYHQRRAADPNPGPDGTAPCWSSRPIMCAGGIVMAVHQDAGLSWLLVVSVPVLAVANYRIISHMLPLFRSMQKLIDTINRVMRDQLAGVRVVRAFAREDFERERFAQANLRCRTPRWRGQLAGADAAGYHLDHQRLQRRTDLVRRLAHQQRPNAGRFADRLSRVLHADPDGGVVGDNVLVGLPRASVCAERITEVLSTRPP